MGKLNMTEDKQQSSLKKVSQEAKQDKGNKGKN